MVAKWYIIYANNNKIKFFFFHYLELGQQALYNVTITFSSSNGQLTTTTRRIGFRVFALVTADDSNPSILEGKSGSSNFTMRFKVNGADVSFLIYFIYYSM